MLSAEISARYQEWLNAPWCDEATKAELQGLQHNEKEIEDRFYCELEFGTGGMRGLLGAGTNRMNIYLIRRLTQALADCISEHGAEAKARGVAIRQQHQSLPLCRAAPHPHPLLCSAGKKGYCRHYDNSQPQSQGI